MSDWHSLGVKPLQRPSQYDPHTQVPLIHRFNNMKCVFRVGSTVYSFQLLYNIQ